MSASEGDRREKLHFAASSSCAVAPANYESTGRKGDKGKKHVRTPRRVLHFSDGVIEEYSTDEEERDRRKEEEKRARERALVDPRTLTWLPWMVHYTWAGGAKALEVCDALGERIAWFFGITSPKYYYEIEDYKRSLAEEEKRKAKEDEEMRGWRDSDLRAAAEGKGREAPIEMEQGVDRGKNKEMDPASLKQ